jgi:hypothetical protein
MFLEKAVLELQVILDLPALALQEMPELVVEGVEGVEAPPPQDLLILIQETPVVLFLVEETGVEAEESAALVVLEILVLVEMSDPQMLDLLEILELLVHHQAYLE